MILSNRFLWLPIKVSVLFVLNEILNLVMRCRCGAGPSRYSERMDSPSILRLFRWYSYFRIEHDANLHSDVRLSR